MHGVFRVAFNLLAQPAHVYVHAARRHEAVRTPDRVQQLIPGEDPVRTRSQIIQQPELQRAERDGLAGMTYPVGRRINSQLADFDEPRRIRRRFGAAE